MIGNPLERLQLDLEAAERDLEDLSEPAGGYSAELAAAFQEEVPVVTGFLRDSVFSDDTGVGVGAVYAGVVARSNPYDERALARVEPADTTQEYVDAVLDHHLSLIYT